MLISKEGFCSSSFCFTINLLICTQIIIINFSFFSEFLNKDREAVLRLLTSLEGKLAGEHQSLHRAPSVAASGNSKRDNSSRASSYNRLRSAPQRDMTIQLIQQQALQQASGLKKRTASARKLGTMRTNYHQYDKEDGFSLNDILYTHIKG
jgi:hypothetical protein